MVAGEVIAVKTPNGHYVKVLIAQAGIQPRLQWTSYSS